MGKVINYFLMCALCAGSALAAVRGPDAVSRSAMVANRDGGNVSSRSAVGGAARSVSSRSATTNQRESDAVRARTASGATRVKVRAGRSATTPRGAVITAATYSARPSRAATGKTTARAATTNVATNTFNSEYVECQDAYFACMDQFCASVDEKYRRCACSSKLDAVKSRERALGNVSWQLQDFKDLNIASILKTPAEVKAMLNASEGEMKLAKKRDTSASMQKLTAISDVLSNTRKNAMSTGGQLDIAGDIKQIWNTTDLISGSNIANLTGEALYNAVHSQCAELVSPQCPSKSVLNMIVSAYGIYIENDCATILAALDKQATDANASIRETNREMTTARLENYDAHNSTAINECVAGVRADLTMDTACGTDFVHCLDLTGMYLTRANGMPIYSAKFYELENQVSLSGDVLTNRTNTKLIMELNRKKEFAKNTLETCRDIADSVWDEFLRQAITEIYQGQQAKIRQVKNECMDVVNKCYDEKTKQLRDYSNIEEQRLLGDRLELSEEMCTEKLAACSNLYGGGSNGLALLVSEMHDITNQKISQNCLATLQEYAQKLCRVPSTDTLHDYPYGCRVYMPGDMLAARDPDCQDVVDVSVQNWISPDDADYWPVNSGGSQLWENWATAQSDNARIGLYACPANREYISCNSGYQLRSGKCYRMPENTNSTGCAAENYVGSLYQKMVAYALQYCMRPSEVATSKVISIEVLGDVNVVMDSIKVDMARVLAAECERQDGVWSTVSDGTDVHTDFYNTTNADKNWGMCRKKTAADSAEEETQGG